MFSHKKTIKLHVIEVIYLLEMMTSSGTLRGPLYFFDQPTVRDRPKHARFNVLHFNLANEGASLSAAIKRNPENCDSMNKELDDAQKIPCQSHEEEKQSTSLAVNGDITTHGRRNSGALPTDEIHENPLDLYKHAAPQLLNELSNMLVRYNWAEVGCMPRGLVNILTYSWQDLTAGAVCATPPSRQFVGEGAEPQNSRTHLSFVVTSGQHAVSEKRKTERTVPTLVASTCPERKTQLHSSARRKRSMLNGHKAAASTTVSFSTSLKSYKEQGWIVQPEKPASDEPPHAALCQWVVDRLEMARIPIKLQTDRLAERGLDRLPVLRHYGDARANVRTGTTGAMARPATVANGMPLIPEVKEYPSLQKLHYGINDSSSFIFYPSGKVAVCQSHSGLPPGGFYTNVFSDSNSPDVLASVTAFGQGAVTDPLSGVIRAVWDQSGGLIYDPDGRRTKAWSWLTGSGPKEKMVIWVSDHITVRLLSGSSAVLSFRSQGENVQLPLAALPDSLLPEEMVSGRPHQVLQMVSEDEGFGELSALSTGGGGGGGGGGRRGSREASADRELKRLRCRARNILEDWMEFYRMATGIRCPDLERMPDAPLRTMRTRKVQSAALPSLNPPETLEDARGWPNEGRPEAHPLPRHLSAPVDCILSSSIKLPRTWKKKMKYESDVMQTETLQVQGNIRLDPVVIPGASDLQVSAAAQCPVQPPPPLSSQVSHCPVLLRAALVGQPRRRLCPCSTKLMPALTDLEYDAFVAGQPPHSEQILVVCVTAQGWPGTTHTTPAEDTLERLYEKRNKNRTMPCTQCQTDSFRLVRYGMATGKTCPGARNVLLHRRHNAAPGMVLMYIRGKLLFVDYISKANSCSEVDLLNQISKTRCDYRLGQSLPPDYKFSLKTKIPAASDFLSLQESPSTPVGRDSLWTTLEKEYSQSYDRKVSLGPTVSVQRRVSLVKTKTSPAAPLPIITR